MNALSSRFRMLRDRVMAYDDDFIRPHTLARIERIGHAMGPLLATRREPDAPLYRAIAHYRGQCSVRNRASLWLTEGVSIALLAVLPFLVLRGLFQKRPAPDRTVRAYYALLAPVSAQVAALYKVPQELADIPTVKNFVPRLWKYTRSDWMLLGRMAVALVRARCPFPFQYIWKCAKDTALMRGYLHAYPDAAFALIAGEYSCATGLAAVQYRQANIPLYNVMHGDNASTPKESFFKIDRFYVWDAHYIPLFYDQRIAADFRVSPNPEFTLAAGEKIADTGVGIVIPMMNFLPSRYADLQALLADFARAIDAIPADVPVTLRPHPAYWHTYDQLRAMIRRPTALSDPRAGPAHAFLLRHRAAAGFYSTVLVEAAHLGMDVFIARSNGSQARADYHGIFKNPHVRHVDPADLPAALSAFISAMKQEQQGGLHVVA